MTRPTPAPQAPAPHPTWQVEWSIDIDPSDASTARGAALKVWTEIFGRGPNPGDDQACVFKVTDPQGREHLVDLAHPEV